MKKLIIISIAFFSMASCNTGNAPDQSKTVDSLKMEVMKQHITDSIVQAQAAKQATVPVNEYPTVTTQPTTAATVHHHHSGGGTINNNTTNNYNNQASTTKTKKPWSAKAKGALIGAGVGAVTGAVVDKRHGEGALVGGLIGAAAGTGTGAIIDDKKKKQTNTNK